jgi:signal transduction histidine kinase
MFSSLSFRLWLTYVLVVGVVIIIAGSAITIYLIRNPSGDRLEMQRLRLLSNIMLQRGQLLNLAQDSFSQPIVQDVVNNADRAAGVRVAIFDNSGNLMSDSRSDVAGALPKWSVFYPKKLLSSRFFRDSMGKQWLYFLAPMSSGYSLLLAEPRQRQSVWNILRDEFLGPFIRGAFLALLLSLLLAFGIAQWISAPLQRITDATHSVPAGKSNIIRLEGPREVRLLAKSFNEMNEQVQATQRSQRDFIANVSHDLKTPLTSIQGFAQAILDGAAGDETSLKQAAGVIFIESERMRQMVQDLLELARLDSGVTVFERLPVDIEILLKGIVEKFSPQAQQSFVTLQYTEGEKMPGGSLTVTGDGDHLAQVFANLVDNALKYTPSGGRVWVASRSMDGWVEVQVSDSGAGIPPDELDRIFERFYQTDKSRRGGSRRGVGLGLAIAREIVRAHGGTILAQNLTSTGEIAQSGAPGYGSIFTVRLPASRPPV